jgi:predicted amidohydrolase YtcJ
MRLPCSLFAVALAACAGQARILRGNVITFDPRRPRAEALAIRDGRIAAVGTLAEVESAVGGATVVDLSGLTILPGLGDAHGHLLSLGRKLSELDLSAIPSYPALVEAVAKAAKALPRGAWVLGRGWDQTRWPGGEFPTHGALSQAVPEHPVFLKRVDGHAALVNARALEGAGLSAKSANPQGGRILRGEGGAPSGVLIDKAMDLVRLPAPSPEEQRAFLGAAVRRCAELGLTQVHDMGMEPATLAALLDLEARGELPIRVVVYLWAGDEKELDKVLATPPHEGPRVTIRGVKIILDGAMGSRGAALLEPYADEPASRGLLLWTEDSFRRGLKRIAARGLQPAVHAIGDRAVALVLEEYARWPKTGLPPRVEHLQLLPPQGRRLLAQARLIASMQPTHATSDMRWVAARLGAERATRAYAWQSVHAAGTPIAFGSDFPVEDPNPLLGLYAAVTRQDPSGAPESGWQPAERLDRALALRAFTEGVASAAGLEKLGRIAEGAPADLSVFDRDLLSAPARELLQARAVRTFVAGKEVFAR